jgi:hypothetical protein
MGFTAATRAAADLAGPAARAAGHGLTDVSIVVTTTKVVWCEGLTLAVSAVSDFVLTTI